MRLYIAQGSAATNSQLIRISSISHWCIESSTEKANVDWNITITPLSLSTQPTTKAPLYSVDTIPGCTRLSQVPTGNSLSYDASKVRSLGACDIPADRSLGFRLTNELAIRSAQPWKHIVNAGVVRVVDIFTNRGFGDSSLFVVTDYHPLSKTLAEQHHVGHGRQVRGRNSIDQVSETTLWSYVTQLASALKTIHNSGLAARVLDTSKILVTGKNRVRLNGCAVLDVVKHEAATPVAQLQKQDLAWLAC